MTSKIITYKVKNVVVTEAEYEEFKQQLVDIQFHRCKVKKGGGVNVNSAKHQGDGKTYFIVITHKNESVMHEIKQGNSGA